MPHAADITANLDSVRRRIDAAAHRVNRSPSDITLVAVSKTFSSDLVRAAALCGQRIFGENRVQEAVVKKAEVGDAALEWHLIGHLQTNKVRKAVTTFDCIQSVDRIELLARLDTAAGESGLRPRILVQVDLAGETTKHGAGRADVDALVEAAATSGHLQLAGLMLVPPAPDVPESSRPWFRQLRVLRDSLLERGVPASNLRHLSMGMSHDFDVAIEEGATIIRVGTAIFGGRALAAP